MNKFVFLIAALSLSACSYNSTMGKDNRFQVDEYTSLLAPSVTVVTDTKTNNIIPIAGQSVVSQLSGPASAAIGGYLIGQGLGDSGDVVSANNGANKNTNSASSNADSNSSSNALSLSRSNSTAISRNQNTLINKNTSVNQNTLKNLNVNKNTDINVLNKHQHTITPRLNPY